MSESRTGLPEEQTAFWNYAPGIITCVAFLGWLWLAYPFFIHGELMNFDHPMHLGVLDCLRSGNPNAIFPATWCDHMMMGVPPFQGYPPLAYMVMAIFSFVLSIPVAYKFVLLLVWLSIPVCVGWYLWMADEPLAGAVAFTFLLFNRGAVDSSGIEFLFLKGSAFNQTLSFALLFLALFFIYNLCVAPSRKSLVYCAVIISLVFLAHPSTIPVLAIATLFLMIQFRKKIFHSLPLFCGFPVLVLLLVSFWLVPFITKLSSFRISGVTAQTVPFLTGVYSYLILPLNVVILAMVPFGLFLMIKKKNHLVTIIPLLAFVTLLTLIFGFGIQVYRLFGLLEVIMLVGAAFAVSQIALIRKTDVPSCIFEGLCLLLVLGIGTSLFIETSVASGELVFSDTLLLGEYRDLLFKSVENSTGRVLVEDTFGQRSTEINRTSLWGRPPIGSNLRLLGPEIGYLTPQFAGAAGGWFDGNYFMDPPGKKSTWPPERIDPLLEFYNIEYVIGSSPTYTRTFSYLGKTFSVPGFSVFRNAVTNLSYFFAGNGRVLEEQVDPTFAHATLDLLVPSEVVFKTRYYPNWKATVNGQDTPIYPSRKNHLIVLKVPSGRTDIRLEYRTLPIDILGWALTFVGVILCIGLILSNQTSDTTTH